MARGLNMTFVTYKGEWGTSGVLFGSFGKINVQYTALNTLKVFDSHPNFRSLRSRFFR